tara:strand:- start:4696 stop:5262 length:567 start_codon:yes stop_codon:yes gene_type:complete
MLMNIRVNISKLLVYLSFSLLLASCGMGEKVKNISKPVDLRNEPLDPDERARRNIEQGRGISLGNLGGNKKTTYEFSTSNPMWRASLETLDFIPLSTVDYSGGMIITDWYSDNSNSSEALKITIRFLSNEIRSDSLKIIIHKKNCRVSADCSINLLPNGSTLNSELRSVILRKASLLEKADKEKIKKK